MALAALELELGVSVTFDGAEGCGAEQPESRTKTRSATGMPLMCVSLVLGLRIETVRGLVISDYENGQPP
jgi:hypothetical protein